MQYEVKLKDLSTGKEFTKMFKNEYFLRRFINKAKRSKKIVIMGIKDLFR